MTATLEPEDLEPFKPGEEACARLEIYAKAFGLDWTIYYGPGIAPGDDVTAFRLSCDGGDRSVIGETESDVRSTIRMTAHNRETKAQRG